MLTEWTDFCITNNTTVNGAFIWFLYVFIESALASEAINNSYTKSHWTAEKDIFTVKCLTGIKRIKYLYTNMLLDVLFVRNAWWNPIAELWHKKKKKEQVHLVHTKKYLTPKLNHENTIILHGQTKELEWMMENC